MDTDSGLSPFFVVSTQHTPPPSAFYEEFDGEGKVSHQLGPLPSAMSVIELEVHFLGIKSSEVKSLRLFAPGPKYSEHLQLLTEISFKNSFQRTS